MVSLKVKPTCASMLQNIEWTQFVLNNCETDCPLSEVCMIKTVPHSTLSTQM